MRRTKPIRRIEKDGQAVVDIACPSAVLDRLLRHEADVARMIARLLDYAEQHPAAYQAYLATR